MASLNRGSNTKQYATYGIVPYYTNKFEEEFQRNLGTEQPNVEDTVNK